MALNKEEVKVKMEERGFTVFATMPPHGIQFISAHMFEMGGKKGPAINIVVDIEQDEFECIYNVPGSLNILKTPKCGSLMNDDHFDRIVCKFESHVRWLARIAN